MYNSAKALLKGIKANFSQMMRNAPTPAFTQLITRVKSNSDKEQYWLPETLPAIKEWIDQRHFGDFADKYFEIANKDYDNGLRVDRNTLDDSREYLGGNVEAWLKMLVDTYQDFPDELCQLILSANSACFDATAMFATTRPNIDTGTNTINNLLTGTSSSTYSLAEFEADYVSAKTALLGLRDKNNRAFNKGAKLGILVPQHMQDTAQKLLDARAIRIYNGSAEKDNLYAGDAEVIVNWEQNTTTDNDWYLINLNAPFKPFLIQDRKAPNWEVWDDMRSKYIDYGFDFRIGYGPLSPFAIVKTNN